MDKFELIDKIEEDMLQRIMESGDNEGLRLAHAQSYKTFAEALATLGYQDATYPQDCVDATYVTTTVEDEEEEEEGTPL
jgi:hypothetical protein